jgi:hypothetical protein
MAKYIEDKIAQLENALQETETLAEIYRAIALIRTTLAAMKQYTRENPFTNPSDEIHYFKVLAPPVYGRLFYYTKMAEIGIEALHSNDERMETLLKLELAKTEQFFSKHGEFCQYYHLNRAFMDDRIFIRDARENEMLDCIEVIMADDFCVGCYWASLLWANQELRGYFNEQLRKLKQPDGRWGGAETVPALEWTDGQIDLMEVSFLLYVKGSFNHGKATLKEIALNLGAHFKKDVGHVYNTVKDIGRRKKGQLKYVDDARDRASKRLDEMI